MRYDFIVFLFCYMGYIWSICGFCKKYLNDLKINKKVFAILLFSAGVSVNTVSVRIGIPYICSMAFSHLLFLSLFLVLFRDNIMKKIFMAMFLIAIKTLVWNFGCSFFSCLFLVFGNIATGGQVTSIGLKMDSIIGAAAYCMVILAFNILKKKLVPVFNNKIKSWYGMLSMPLLFIIVMVDVVNWGASNGIMVVSNANGAEYWNVYYNQIFSHIAICLLTILGMCIAAGLVFGMNKIYMEQRQKEQYYSQIEFYKMLNEQYLQMERLRHDMKNHMLALHGLWENGEFEKIGNYLGKMLESGNIGINDEVTGNNAIDALLYNKKKEAEQKEICWECEVQIPKNCMVDEFDLCVLFGNIIDNALNASNEMEDGDYRFVRVQAYKVKQCLLFVVQNKTVMKDIREMKQGIGFLNVNETVQKYNGVIHTKIENNVFEVSILLPMNRNVYNMKRTT